MNITKHTIVGGMGYCNFCGEKCLVSGEVDSGRWYSEYLCICEHSKVYSESLYLLERHKDIIKRYDDMEIHKSVRVLIAKNEIDFIKRKLGLTEGDLC